MSLSGGRAFSVRTMSGGTGHDERARQAGSTRDGKRCAASFDRAQDDNAGGRIMAIFRNMTG